MGCTGVRAWPYYVKCLVMVFVVILCCLVSCVPSWASTRERKKHLAVPWTTAADDIIILPHTVIMILRSVIAIGLKPTSLDVATRGKLSPDWTEGKVWRTKKTSKLIQAELEDQGTIVQSHHICLSEWTWALWKKFQEELAFERET